MKRQADPGQSGGPDPRLSHFESERFVNKYRSTRHRPEELFPSERRFLPRVLRPGIRVLDVGCACGGFYNILRTLEPRIDYTGVDVSDLLIEEARRCYPDGRFETVDGRRLPFGDEEFDLVQVWGVTLVEPEYRSLLAEAWRVAGHVLLFDIRLQQHGCEVIDMERSYVSNEDGERNYYIVPNGHEFLGWLGTLEPAPRRIEAFGYEGKPNAMAVLPATCHPVYMTAFALFRNTGDAAAGMELDLPEPFLSELAAAVGDRSRLQAPIKS